MGGAGWRRRPQVFAEFDGETAAPDLEQLVRTDTDAAELRVGLEINARPGNEPAALVELAVVGQRGLGHDSGDAAVCNYRGRVEQPSVGTRPGSSHHDGCLRAGAGDPGERLARIREQPCREQQVFGAVAGETEFGKHRQRRAAPFEPGEVVDNLFGVGSRFRELYHGRDRDGSQESEIDIVRGLRRHAQF